MGLTAPRRGEAWAPSASARLASFTFSVDPRPPPELWLPPCWATPRLGSRERFSLLVAREGLSTCSPARPPHGPSHRVM